MDLLIKTDAWIGNKKAYTFCRNSTVPFNGMISLFIFSDVVLSCRYLGSLGCFRIFSVISFKNCNPDISLKANNH